MSDVPGLVSVWTIVGIVNDGNGVLVGEVGLVLPFLTKAITLLLFSFRSAVVGILLVRSPSQISSIDKSNLLGCHHDRRLSGSLVGRLLLNRG